MLDRSAASLGDADALAHPLVRALAGTLTAHDTLAVTGSDQIARQRPNDALAELERGWSRAAAAFDLTAVLKALHDRGHAGAVVLVTGGLVADDAAAVAAATALGVPVHAIGVGAAPNRALLAAIATATGGTVRFAGPDADLAAMARDVIGDAAAPPPVLTVNWGTLAASDVRPGAAALARRRPGQALRGGEDRAAAAGERARRRRDVFRSSSSPPNPVAAGCDPGRSPACAAVGARPPRRSCSRAAHPDAKAIETFALRYGLVSPYTAMIAVGSDVVERGGVKHSVSVPVSVPAGMRWQAVDRQDRVDHSDEARLEHEKTGKDHANAGIERIGAQGREMMPRRMPATTRGRQAAGRRGRGSTRTRASAGQAGAAGQPGTGQDRGRQRRSRRRRATTHRRRR